MESILKLFFTNNPARLILDYRCLSVCAVLLLFWGVSSAGDPMDQAKFKLLMPPLLICGKNKNVLTHVNSHGKLDWDYTLDGPILDVQPQTSDRFLVTGGTQQVAYLRKVWKGCRVLWDWESLEDVSIQSAVAMDWDENGDLALVLAADAKNSRLFLADPQSKSIKIRWEYKLPAPPLSARVCPDSNNFFVVLKNSTLLEILYQEDKVVWSMGVEDGLKDVRDAVRGPWGHTYVAEGSEGLILCFDPQKKLVWKTHLPFAPSLSFRDITLSILKKNGKRMVMAAVHWPSGPGAKDVIYFLNAETGKVLAWSDRSDKGSYPSFRKAVPDLPGYHKKD